jgi:hypothetical protein
MAVTYQYPVSGASPPSAVLMKKRQQVIATAVYTTGNNDPTPIVHNLGVSADGSDGQPVIDIAMLVQAATAVVPTVAFTDANTVTLTPNHTAGGATDNFTARVTLSRRK